MLSFFIDTRRCTWYGSRTLGFVRFTHNNYKEKIKKLTESRRVDILIIYLKIKQKPIVNRHMEGKF